MKVYVITTGEYSDRQIERIFMNKEKAEKYEDLCGNGCLLEEYETSDDNINFEGIPTWVIGVDYDLVLNKIIKYDIFKSSKSLTQSFMDKKYIFYPWQNTENNLILRISKEFNRLENETEEEIKEKYYNKYLKVCQDLSTFIKAQASDGATIQQIDEMLNNQ